MTQKLDPIYNTPPNNPNFLECKITKLTRSQLAYYLNEGYKDLFEKYPSKNSLAILWAQNMMEHGGTMLRNWNYGNIKFSKRNQELGIYTKHTYYLAGEYINGTHRLFYPFNPQCKFAAWDTAQEGAIGYIKFLSIRSRYKAAWDQLLKGNVTKYTIALKSGGYFTDKLDHYMKHVVALYKTFHNHYDEYMSWKPEPKAEPKIEPEPPTPTTEPDIPIIEPEEPLEPEETISEPEPSEPPEEPLSPLEPEIDPNIEIEEPKEDITNNIPGEDEEKAKTLIYYFFLIWQYILKFIESLGGKK